MSMMSCVHCSRSIDTDFNAESCDTGRCVCPYCMDKMRNTYSFDCYLFGLPVYVEVNGFYEVERVGVLNRLIDPDNEATCKDVLWWMNLSQDECDEFTILLSEEIANVRIF